MIDKIPPVNVVSVYQKDRKRSNPAVRGSIDQTLSDEFCSPICQPMASESACGYLVGSSRNKNLRKETEGTVTGKYV
jgi:hypothetical protein